MKRDLSEISGPRSEGTGQTYFVIRDWPDVINETRTFSKIWVPHCEVITNKFLSKWHNKFAGPFSLKRGPFMKYGDLIMKFFFFSFSPFFLFLFFSFLPFFYFFVLLQRTIFRSSPGCYATDSKQNNYCTFKR